VTWERVSGAPRPFLVLRALPRRERNGPISSVLSLRNSRGGQESSMPSWQLSVGQGALSRRSNIPSSKWWERAFLSGKQAHVLKCRTYAGRGAECGRLVAKGALAPFPNAMALLTAALTAELSLVGRAPIPGQGYAAQGQARPAGRGPRNGVETLKGKCLAYKGIPARAYPAHLLTCLVQVRALQMHTCALLKLTLGLHQPCRVEMY